MGDVLTCVYVTDRGFLPYTCFSVKTLVENSTIPVDVVILCADVEPACVADAERYLGALRATVSFIPIPDSEFDGLPRPKSLPRATYGRLMMDKLLPRNLDRVLYVDGDTLVDVDIAPLADEPLDGCVVGAVLDIGRVLIGRREEAQARLDLGADGDYFNAGILLVDWQKWLDLDIGGRCLTILGEDPERFTQKDQCALNFVCRNNWKRLDLQWNFQPACVVYDDRPRALFHFLGGRKPWRSDHLRHPMRFVQRYERLHAGSPWAKAFTAPSTPYFLKEWARLVKRVLTPRYWKNMSRYWSTAKRYGSR